MQIQIYLIKYKSPRKQKLNRTWRKRIEFLHQISILVITNQNIFINLNLNDITEFQQGIQIIHRKYMKNKSS